MATIAEKVNHDTLTGQNEGSPDEPNLEDELQGMTLGELQARAAESEKFADVLKIVDRLFSGDGEITDVSKAALDNMSEAERQEALDNLPNMIRETASQEAESRRPRPEYGAKTIPTIRLGFGGEEILLEHRSHPQYTLIAQLENEWLPFDPRPHRIVVVEPSSTDGIPEGLPELDIPAPTSKKARMAIKSGVELGEWQRKAVRSRVKSYLRENDLLPVKADPNKGVDGCPAQEWTIKAFDRGFVEAVADGTEEMHYLSSAVSGGGFAGADRENSPLPKQSSERAVLLSPQEISAITELLVGAVFAEEDNIVRDGGSPYIPSAESEGTWKTLEGQFRAVSAPTSVAEQLKAAETKETALDLVPKLSIAKGTLRPYRRAFVRKRLRQFRQDLRDLYHENRERYKTIRDRYWRAHELLRKALSADDDTLFLAKGDQAKIEGGPSSYEGRALITRTFLEGQRADHDEPSGETSISYAWRPDYSPSPERKRAFAAHIRTEASVRKKPVQYPMVMNPQLFQLMKPSAETDFWVHLRARANALKEKLSTTKGIAELVSDHEARTLEEIENGESISVEQEKTLLNLALQTGTVQMEAKAREAALKGESTSPEDIHMPPQVHARLDAVLAARVKRRLLRGLGGEGKGYLHATVQNSQQTVLRLWGNNGVEALDRTNGTIVRPREYPFYDPSAVTLPQRIAKKLNADDDGDLTNGIACKWALENGRVVTAVLIWRYPCVDEPVVWLLPAGARTPFDAESSEERATYEDIMGIFDPQLPEGEPPIRSDGITLAEPVGTWRLKDNGAKESVTQERITGEITLENAFSFCERGASLDQAGPLTRDLERFGELIRRSRAEANAKPSRREYFRRAEEEFLRRGGEANVAVEEVLSAFKYHTKDGAFRSPPFVPDMETLKDPLRMGGEENVQDILPMDYHNEIRSIERTTEKYASEMEVSLEDLSLTVGCRISRYLQHLLSTKVPEIIEAFRSIDTDVSYFAHGPKYQNPGGLQKDLREFREEVDENTISQIDAQSQKCRQAMAVWRFCWSLLMQEQEDILRSCDPIERQDTLEALADERQAISQTLRRYMRSVAKDKSKHALRLAIYHDWGPQENSAAAGMALISDRLGEVFPAPNVNYKEVPDPEDTAVVYCHDDLPGQLFEKVSITKMTLQDDGSAVAEIGGSAYHLRPANEQESISNLLPAASMHLRRVSRRRGVLEVQ